MASRRKIIALLALFICAAAVVGVVLAVPVVPYASVVGLRCPATPNFVDFSGIPCGPPYMIVGAHSEGSLLFNFGGYTVNGTYRFDFSP